MMHKIFVHAHIFATTLILKLISFYKKGISPLLPHACRYEPTCSEYMMQAIKKHGLVHGIYLGIRRLLRCHPWGGSGYDPVPDRLQKKHSRDKDTVKRL